MSTKFKTALFSLLLLPSIVCGLGVALLGGGGVTVAPPITWEFTVDATGSIDPVVTAAGLADGDVTWTRPNLSEFTGKTPASANFNANGEYSLSLTDWEQMTGFDFHGDAISGDISGWTFPSSLAILNLYSTSVSGDLSAWTLPSSLAYLQIYSTSVSGDISGWTLPNSLIYLYVYSTSVSGDVSGWTLPATLTHLQMHTTSVSGDISQWTLPGSLTNLGMYSTSVDYGTGNALDGLTNTIVGPRFDDCAWSTAEVDRALADCVDSGISTETINFGGTNAAPTGVGDPSSYWTLVEDRSWTVTVTAP